MKHISYPIFLLLIVFFSCKQATTSQIKPIDNKVVVYNTHGFEDETRWTVISGTPDTLDPVNTVIENGFIRITYPVKMGQPGKTGHFGNEKAGHLIYINTDTGYELAQDIEFGDWIYVGGSFVDDPTGFKILQNTPDICEIVLEFDNHRMIDEDNSLNPCKKHITLRRGHYGYTISMDVQNASYGEYEAGFGGTNTHLFTYSTKYGYKWALENPAPSGQNYQFLRKEDQQENQWWAAGIVYDNSYFRLVALKPSKGHTPALRTFQFIGGLTGGIIRYSWSSNFSDYEVYVAVVPYDGSNANKIVYNDDKATITVPENGKYAIYSKTENLGSTEDRRNGDKQGNSRRYDLVFNNLNLKSGKNEIELNGTKLVDAVVAPISNGLDFPEDIAKRYQNQ